MKVFIPFSGFYESQWIAALDYEEESLAEYLTSGECTDYAGFDFTGRTIDYLPTNYTAAAWSSMAKAWTEYFADELHTDTGIRVRYAECISPREYNFSTDRIECDISRAALRKMRAAVTDETLNRIAAERHTSRSGFHSFYSPDVSTWGRVDQWDGIQAETLLLAFMEDQGCEPSEEDCIEHLSGNGFFSDLVDAAFDAAALHASLTTAKEQAA